MANAKATPPLSCWGLTWEPTTGWISSALTSRSKCTLSWLVIDLGKGVVLWTWDTQYAPVLGNRFEMTTPLEKVSSTKPHQGSSPLQIQSTSLAEKRSYQMAIGFVSNRLDPSINWGPAVITC